MSLEPLPQRALSPALVPQPARILAVSEEVPGTVTLRLEAPARGDTFQPGQFYMLYAFGIGEAPISCSGDPDASHELVHTIRAVGPVTRALTATEPGEIIGVRGPFGSIWPLEEARGLDVLFIAGGLGIAPLRPPLLYVLNRRDAYGRVMMLYGARSPEELLYATDRRAWAGREDMELHVTVDHAAPGWKGAVGVVPALLERLALDPSRTVVMMCGPEVMMRFTVRELERLGLGAERLFVSMERNMKCATGFCGHCQFGPVFVCKDGPVFRFDRVAPLLSVREV